MVSRAVRDNRVARTGTVCSQLHARIEAVQDERDAWRDKAEQLQARMARTA